MPHMIECLQAVRRVLSRMHAREQELSNALAETSTFAMHHLQVSLPCPTIHTSSSGMVQLKMALHRDIELV